MRTFNPCRLTATSTISRPGLLVGLCALVLLASMAITPSRASSAASATVRAPISSHAGPLARSKAHLPDGLYPALIKAEEHSTSPAYRIHAEGASFIAHNPADHLGLRFDRSGVAIFPSTASTAAGLHIHFVGIGRASSRHIVGARTQRVPVAPLHRQEVSFSASGQRGTYHRGPIQESYINGPVGLEQGLTIASPPDSVARRSVARSVARNRPLVLTLQVQGAQSARLQSGSIIFTLTGSHGSAGTTLHYGDLYVHDATGRRLAAHIDLGTGQPQGIAPTHPESRTRNAEPRAWNVERGTWNVSLVIDDRGARYPLTIDPTITAGTPYALSAPGAKDFGYTVALSGDGSVALVGAPSTNNNAGAAYVFTEPSGGWADAVGPAAVLTGPNASGLGGVVALNGDGSVAVVTSELMAFEFTESTSGWSTPSGPTATLTVPSGVGVVAAALSGDGSVAILGTFTFSEFTACHGVVYTEPSSGWSGTSASVATLDEDSASTTACPVALSEDGRTALIGGAGGGVVADVFSEPGAGWAATNSPSAWLAPGDTTSLGTSVALSGKGTIALVGEPSGSRAQVFVAPSGGWSGSVNPSATLSVAGLSTDSDFGSSVSLSGGGDVALVGAYFVNRSVGAAYIFRRPSSGTWTDTSNPDETLSASGTSAFGCSVALSGDGSTTLVGANATNNSTGAAYVQATSAPLFVDGGIGSNFNDCSAGNPCKTIQHALDVASLNHEVGATINISGTSSGFDGVYCERLVIPFSLHLQAAAPSNPPAIDGGGTGIPCGGSASNPPLTISPGEHVALSHLTVQNGTGLPDSTFGTTGGGIYNRGGTIYLSHDHITNNHAVGSTATGSSCIQQSARGGGIENEAGGFLFLIDTSADHNTAQGGNAASGSGCAGGSAAGGGIDNEARTDPTDPAGTVTLRRSSVTDNSVIGGHGNLSGAGGDAAGGGIETSNTLWMTASTIGANTATGGDGGSSIHGSPGAGGAATGGGIDHDFVGGPAQLTLTNSTVAENNATGGLGAASLHARGFAAGGGLHIGDAVAGSYALVNVTVAENTVFGGTGGGGIYGPANQPVATLTNTILAANTISSFLSDPDCRGMLADGPIQTNSGTVAIGSNIAGDKSANCSGLTSGVNSDQVGTDAIPVDPKLDPSGLQSNGGPTPTIALTVGSPAIGAADHGVCQLSSVANVDQRGYPRNADSRNACDVGAYDTNALTIAKGWNLIGVPTPSASTKAASGLVASLDSQLGTSAVTALATYARGAFQLSVPGFTAEQSLPPSQGILVLSAKAGVWVPPGIVAYASGQTVNLQPGWNLVAAPFPVLGLTGDQIYGEIGSSGSHGCGLQEVATYTGGSYQTYTPSGGPSGSAFHVANMQGMWIECANAESNWQPS